MVPRLTQIDMKSRKTLLNMTSNEKREENTTQLKNKIQVGENIGGVAGRASMEKLLLTDTIKENANIRRQEH